MNGNVSFPAQGCSNGPKANHPMPRHHGFRRHVPKAHLAVVRGEACQGRSIQGALHPTGSGRQTPTSDFSHPESQSVLFGPPPPLPKCKWGLGKGQGKTQPTASKQIGSPLPPIGPELHTSCKRIKKGLFRGCWDQAAAEKQPFGSVNCEIEVARGKGAQSLRKSCCHSDHAKRVACCSTAVLLLASPFLGQQLTDLGKPPNRSVSGLCHLASQHLWGAALRRADMHAQAVQIGKLIWRLGHPQSFSQRHIQRNHFAAIFWLMWSASSIDPR